MRRSLLPVLLAWLLLLTAAWGLWLWQLDGSDLTFDESATYFVAHRPLPEIVSYLQGAVREHPPLYYLLIHGWMVVAGSSEFSLRFFSVCMGMIALALTGWVARLTRTSAGAARGLLPAFLLAATPGMAYYARDARMYTLCVVWAALSAGLFLRDWLLETGWPGRIAIVALVIIHLLAIFTHYYLLLVIFVQPLVLLVLRRWRPLLAWCAVHGLLALAGLAWLWLAPGLQMTAGGIWRGLAFALPTRFQVFRLLGKVLFSPIVQVRFHLLYYLLALAAGGLLLALWRRRAAGVWLTLASLVPLTLVYQLPHPPEARYLIFLTLPVALALGFPATAPLCLRRRWLAWGAALGLVLGMAALLASGGLSQSITHDRSHYGETLLTIRAHVRSGDGLLFYGPWQEFLFRYYDPGGLPPATLLPPYAPPLLEPAAAEPVLRALLAQHERLWVILAAVDDVDPAHFAAGWLNTHAHAVWRGEGFKLYLPPLPPDAPARPVQVVFGDVLRLERVAWEPQPLLAGDPLRLTLYWSPLRRLEDDVQITLKLTAASGYAWDQVQSVPGAWAYPPSQWEPGEVITDYEGLMVPPGAPPGEYTVRLLAAGTEVDLVTVTVTDTTQALAPSGLIPRCYLPYIVASGTDASGDYSLPDDVVAVFCSPGNADCLALVGYEPGGVRFQQGYPVPLLLHWLSPSRPLPELHLHLEIAHRSWLGLPGTPIVSQTLPLAPTYPAPLWVPDRLVTLPTALLLPPDAPVGRARVTIQVSGPDGAPWRTEDGQTAFALFDLTVERRPAQRRLPRGLTPVQVDFGAAVGLRGYRVEGEARPGGELHLTYAWYAHTQPTAIYAVFNHLVTADGTTVAQADGWPQEGQQLSTQWQPGDYIEDHYTLTIPADAPPGPYRLYIGLYDAMTSDRLPAFQDGQRLPDDRVPIPLPGEDGR